MLAKKTARFVSAPGSAWGLRLLLRWLLLLRRGLLRWLRRLLLWRLRLLVVLLCGGRGLRRPIAGQRALGARRYVRHCRHLLHLPLFGVGDLNAEGVERGPGDTVELYTRLLVRGHGRHQVRLRHRKVALRLQHLVVGGSTQGIFLLLRVQRLVPQSDRSLCRLYPRPVLLEGELRVPHLDADLVLQLLQA